MMNRLPFSLLILFLITTAEAKMPSSQMFPIFSESTEEKVENALDYRNAKGEQLIYQNSGEQPNQWSQLDPNKDGIEGTATASAYANPKMPNNKKEVIVAVIDSGVDIQHEDLKGKIWINHAELNGSQGVDDDGNGFVDDIHGWNFLGNRDGRNIDATTLEVTREYARLKKKAAKRRLNDSEQAYLVRIQAQFEEEKSDAQNSLLELEEIHSAIILLKKNGLEAETIEALNKVEDSSDEIIMAKSLAEKLFLSRIKNSTNLKASIEDNKIKLQYCYNEKFDSSSVVGDHPNELEETGYGNSDVTGPDASHGTHVAGIIAANRGNGLGIVGQADTVKIMSIRTVPNGDERDKDVANAILYAVKNGAKVINMSFGKQFSPYKKAVDKAVLYAESKGVILVHASGNSGKNTEKGYDNFPLRKVRENTPLEKEVNNWIEVGASDKYNNQKLPAYFSNFGKTTIDLFAPGVGIISTIPGNQYASFNGTSMATPEVAGVVALMMSRFPLLTTREIRDAVVNNTTQYLGVIVNIPCKGYECTGAQISFSELSRTGGIVNANAALEALDTLVNR